MRSCSGDVHVARVHVIVLVVHAVVGLTLGLMARVVVIVFVVAILHIFSSMGDILFTPPVGDSELLLAATEYHCNSDAELMLRIIPRIIGPITVSRVSPID